MYLQCGWFSRSFRCQDSQKCALTGARLVSVLALYVLNSHLYDDVQARLEIMAHANSILQSLKMNGNIYISHIEHKAVRNWRRTDKGI